MRMMLKRVDSLMAGRPVLPKKKIGLLWNGLEFKFGYLHFFLTRQNCNFFVE